VWDVFCRGKLGGFPKKPKENRELAGKKVPPRVVIKPVREMFLARGQRVRGGKVTDRNSKNTRQDGGEASGDRTDWCSKLETSLEGLLGRERFCTQGGVPCGGSRGGVLPGEGSIFAEGRDWRDPVCTGGGDFRSGLKQNVIAGGWTLVFGSEAYLIGGGGGLAHQGVPNKMPTCVG